MMLTGCFGLVAALKAKLATEDTARQSRNQKTLATEDFE
jgi:hypothetical protein